MNVTTPHYGPPILPESGLKITLAQWYPAHNASQDLLAELVEEYKRFWRLILNFPQKRVVAPGSIMAVQRVHESDRVQYYNDCISYFRKFMHPRDLAWRGHTDHRGMFDTMFSYQELFKAEPPRAWADMNRLLLDKKKNPSRVKSARTYKRPSRPRNVGSGGFFLRYIQQPVAHYYFTAPAATMPGARTGL